MSTTINPIGLGAAPNDGNGDPLRDGGQIINDNFVKLHKLSNKIDETLLQVYKYPGNTDISITEQNDVVVGIIEEGGIKYKIEAQYDTGITSDFGTAAGFFNDGSYKTSNFRQLL